MLTPRPAGFARRPAAPGPSLAEAAPRRTWLRAGLLLVLAGCLDDLPGLSTPRSFCRENAAVECKAFYECFDESGRAEAQAQAGQTWSGQADCVAQRQAACDPDPRVCQPGETFQEQHATSCLTARKALTCPEWRDPMRRQPPACVRCEMVTPVECVGSRISYCTTGP